MNDYGQGWRKSTLAKATVYPGESYGLPWRKLRITLAKATVYLSKAPIYKAKNAPEDKKKKIEEKS